MAEHDTRPTTPVDLADPGLYERGIPHDVFSELRGRPGLAWNPIGGDAADGFWAVTRHADVSEVSRDPAIYSSAVGHIQIYDIDADALDSRASMIDMDPPMHTRLRRLVSSAFTPRHVEAYRAAIEIRVGRRLDALVAAGGGDWVEHVAAPIPIGVICDIMGVPEADHDHMIELSDHLVAGTSSAPLDPGAYGNTTDLRLLPFNSPAAFGINEYARALGDRRRRDPADDLITKLIEAEVEGERLTEEEFANFFRLMIFAGNETTRAAMAHLALHLVEFADEFDRVRVDGSLLESVTEEVIRYSSPILYFRRTARVDTELSGTRIRAGEKVVMWYAAANFDAEVFADARRFDAARPVPPANVAFGGGGAHFCLGASLARLELAVLIEEILRRELRIEIEGTPTFVDSNFVNSIERLEVRVR
jgi:cholest-4-en-3-one 26-monooxygenase